MSSSKRYFFGFLLLNSLHTVQSMWREALMQGLRHDAATLRQAGQRVKQAGQKAKQWATRTKQWDVAKRQKVLKRAGTGLVGCWATMFIASGAIDNYIIIKKFEKLRETNSLESFLGNESYASAYLKTYIEENGGNPKNFSFIFHSGGAVSTQGIRFEGIRNYILLNNSEIYDFEKKMQLQEQQDFIKQKFIDASLKEKDAIIEAMLLSSGDPEVAICAGTMRHEANHCLLNHIVSGRVIDTFSFVGSTAAFSHYFSKLGKYKKIPLFTVLAPIACILNTYSAGLVTAITKKLRLNFIEYSADVSYYADPSPILRCRIMYFVNHAKTLHACLGIPFEPSELNKQSMILRQLQHPVFIEDPHPHSWTRVKYFMALLDRLEEKQKDPIAYAIKQVQQENKVHDFHLDQIN